MTSEGLTKKEFESHDETEESKIKDIMERIFTQYRKEYKGTSLLPKYEYISMMKEEKKEGTVMQCENETM